MLTENEKTFSGIGFYVDKVFRAEFEKWDVMNGRPEPRYKLVPSTDLGWDEGKWEARLQRIGELLAAHGYPAFAKQEIWGIANKTVAKPIAAASESLCEAVYKKLNSGQQRTLVAGLKNAFKRLTGRQQA